MPSRGSAGFCRNSRMPPSARLFGWYRCGKLQRKAQDLTGATRAGRNGLGPAVELGGKRADQARARPRLVIGRDAAPIVLDDQHGVLAFAPERRADGPFML